MEVGDAHRHQHLRLYEVHGSLVSADGGADGVGIRRAGRRLGLSFGAMASPGPRGAELGGKIVGAQRGAPTRRAGFSPGLTRPRLQMPQ